MLSRVDVGLSLRHEVETALKLTSPTPLWVWEKPILRLWDTLILFVTISVYNI